MPITTRRRVKMHWIATSFTECISVDYPNIIISQPIYKANSQLHSYSQRPVVIGALFLLINRFDGSYCVLEIYSIVKLVRCSYRVNHSERMCQNPTTDRIYRHVTKWNKYSICRSNKKIYYIWNNASIYNRGTSRFTPLWAKQLLLLLNTTQSVALELYQIPFRIQ
jgi:hypothetical protein